MAVSLSDLQAFETDLLNAIADPNKAVFYDHFRAENRPVSELQTALDQVRREMSALTAGDSPRVKRLLPIAVSDY